MAQPGKISLPKNGRQTLFKAATKTHLRLYRVTNTGNGLLGVTYTDDVGDASRSAQLSPGQSMDFLASAVEARDDSAQGASGLFEVVG